MPILSLRCLGRIFSLLTGVSSSLLHDGHCLGADGSWIMRLHFWHWKVLRLDMAVSFSRSMA